MVYSLMIDHEDERFDHQRQHLIVLSGLQGGVPRRIALTDPTPESLHEAAKTFSKDERPSSLALAATESLDWNAERNFEESAYRERARSVFASAQRPGSSRIIYRSAHLQSVFSEQRLLSASQHVQLRSQRTRGGVLMAAWAGDEVATAHDEVSGHGGPELFELSDQRLEQVAQDTLSHLHARSAPQDGDEVILSPPCAAMLAHHAIAACPVKLDAPPSNIVRVFDDPQSGYGRLAMDDEGKKPALHALVGSEGTALPTNGRMRFDEAGELRKAPTHLRIETEESSLPALVSRVKAGVLLEGPELCALDARGERFSLLSSRAREIRDGRFTGRLFARTLTTAHLAKFISTTIALGDRSETVSFEANGIGSSAEAPYWLGLATVTPG